MQVDYNEAKNRGNATKQQAAALRQRAATAMLNLGPPPAPAAKAGPWLDLTPGARFSPRVSTFPAHHDRGRTCLDDVLWCAMWSCSAMQTTTIPVLLQLSDAQPLLKL